SHSRTEPGLGGGYYRVADDGRLAVSRDCARSLFPASDWMGDRYDAGDVARTHGVAPSRRASRHRPGDASFGSRVPVHESRVSTRTRAPRRALQHESPWELL